MKHFTEYSAKSLYGFFKPEEICFVVEKKYDWISDTSDVTDDLKEAKELARENDYQIFIYKKMFAKDCLYSEEVFNYLVEDVEDMGYSSEYLLNSISEEDKKEFLDFTEKWFNKIVKDAWFADELVGVLKDG